MKKVFIAAAALTAASAVGLATPASADEGNHLGQIAQECTAGFDFGSLGEAIHFVVVGEGNFAGGVPMGLATYCLP